MEILALDPGAKNCGWAYLKRDGISCFTHEPWQAVEWFDDLIEQHGMRPEVVVMEQWVSYPHANAGNAWQQLTEVRVLGCIEFICRKNGISFVFQPTGILTPTMARATANGYKWTASNRDEKAAETHLYHYLGLGLGLENAIIDEIGEWK